VEKGPGGGDKFLCFLGLFNVDISIREVDKIKKSVLLSSIPNKGGKNAGDCGQV
jgi:hypothetical protein